MLEHIRPYPEHIDYEELINEGLRIIDRGVLTFDVSRRYKFSTYVCRTIIRRCSYLSQHNTYRPLPLEPSKIILKTKENGTHDLINEELENILAQIKEEALTSRERTIIERRFPYNSNQKDTLNEIGKSLKISKERVRQIQNTALVKMKEALAEQYNIHKIGDAI